MLALLPYSYLLEASLRLWRILRERGSRRGRNPSWGRGMGLPSRPLYRGSTHRVKGSCAFAPGAISPFVLTSSESSRVLRFSLGHRRS